MNDSTDHLSEPELIKLWFTPFSDHQYWGKLGHWSLHQGISLLLDKCPDLVGEDIVTVDPEHDYRSNFANEYISLLRIANTTLKDDKKLFQEIFPPDFIKWADDKEIFVPDELREAVAKYYGKNKTNNQTGNADNKLSVFHEMDDLSYDEVTLTFVAGDMIEIEARGTKIKVGYELLSLKNLHTGKLNKQGEMLFAFAHNNTVNISGHTKHKQSLKKTINQALIMSGDPFPVKDDSPKYYATRFNIEDKRDRADERAKVKAEKTLFDQNEQYQDSKSRELDELANVYLDEHQDENSS